MTSKHLSDEDIQAWISGEHQLAQQVTAHLEHCASCRVKAEQFQLLFSTLQEQPPAVFDFSVSELVLQQLDTPAVKNKDKYLVYWVILSIILVFGAIVYIFYDSFAFLLNSIVSYGVYVMITIILSIMIFLCIDLYNNFRKKMKLLDFHGKSATII